MNSQLNSIFDKTKNYFLAFCIVSCYPIYSIGQIWLYSVDQRSVDFYQKITKYTTEWTNAHLLLMLAILLMIPAFSSISRYLNSFWAQLSLFFITLSTFVLFGQFTIDLCLVEIFKLPESQAYDLLDKIQNNTLIEALFYDNSKLFFLFKYADFALIAQLTMAIALFKSKKIPKWALIVFSIAFFLTFFGMLFHPEYGRIIKRISYSLFGIAFLPIAIKMIKRENS